MIPAADVAGAWNRKRWMTYSNSCQATIPTSTRETLAWTASPCCAVAATLQARNSGSHSRGTTHQGVLEQASRRAFVKKRGWPMSGSSSHCWYKGPKAPTRDTMPALEGGRRTGVGAVVGSGMEGCVLLSPLRLLLFDPAGWGVSVGQSVGVMSGAWIMAAGSSLYGLGFRSAAPEDDALRNRQQDYGEAHDT